MDNLKEKTAKGLLWGALNSGTMQVLNLVFGIFLARMLSPHDYGIVGVLAIFTLIAGNLQSSGFTQGLTNIKQPTANDYNSVFWFNVSVSIVYYIILFFCSTDSVVLSFRRTCSAVAFRILRIPDFLVRNNPQCHYVQEDNGKGEGCDWIYISLDFRGLRHCVGIQRHGLLELGMAVGVVHTDSEYLQILLHEKTMATVATCGFHSHHEDVPF